MGYTTTFSGQIDITPPLNTDEVRYLRAFAATDRDRACGDPYFVDTSEPEYVNGVLVTSLSYAEPPAGQPGYSCQWVPTSDGTALEWNGGEKFYYSLEWMQYLIDHFLTGEAGTFKSDPRSTGFTFDHHSSGEIVAQGEAFDDRWLLVVEAGHATGVGLR